MDNSANGQAGSPAQSGPPRRMPPQNQAAMAMHFYGSLRQYIAHKNIPCPPNLFTLRPADPNVPGSTPTPPGAFDVFGRKIDLLRLYVGTLHMGGHAKVTATQGWPRLASTLGLAPQLPAPYPLLQTNNTSQTQLSVSQDSGEVVSNIYTSLLLGFEEHTRQQSSAVNNARQQANVQGPSSSSSATDNKAPGLDSTETATKVPDVETAGQPKDTPLFHQSVNHVQSEPSTLTLRTPTPQDTIAAVPNIPTSQFNSGRTEGEMLALRQKMLLQAQQRAMLQGVQKEAQVNGVASSSSTAASASTIDPHPRPTPSAATPPGDANHSKAHSKSPGAASNVSKDGKHDVLSPRNANNTSLKRKASETEDNTGLRSPRTGIPPKSPQRQESSSQPPPEKPVVIQPRRIRHRIEYRPLVRRLDSYGGWDLARITNDRREDQLAREPLMVENLGRIDIEGLCMSIRSRLKSELSYALVSLDMLSMPGKGDDKGGLGLVHCGELLNELVDLVEEGAFGIDGWRAWHNQMMATTQQDSSLTSPTPSSNPTIECHTSHDTLLSLARTQEFSSTLAQGSPSAGSRQRIELVFVAVNLLRNFSLMSDNYVIMTKHLRFVEIMIRLCDTRLIRSQEDDQQDGDEGPAPFQLTDVLRLREDVLDILHGLSAHINLTLLPSDAASLLFDLTLSHLKGLQTDSVSRRLLPGLDDGLVLPEGSTLALEVLSQITAADHNRLVLRKIDPQKIVNGFIICLRYLAFQDRDASALHRHLGCLDIQGKLVVCLYNLAFLAPASVRTSLRQAPGVMLVLGLSLEMFNRTSPPQAYTLIIRRLSETIGTLNGSDELSGQGKGLTFGANASARGLKGLGDSKEAVEPGILATREDHVLIEMLEKGRRTMMLDGIALGEVSRAIWAI